MLFPFFLLLNGIILPCITAQKVDFSSLKRKANDIFLSLNERLLRLKHVDSVQYYLSCWNISQIFKMPSYSDEQDRIKYIGIAQEVVILAKLAQLFEKGYRPDRLSFWTFMNSDQLIKSIVKEEFMMSLSEKKDNKINRMSDLKKIHQKYFYEVSLFWKKNTDNLQKVEVDSYAIFRGALTFSADDILQRLLAAKWVTLAPDCQYIYYAVMMPLWYSIQHMTMKGFFVNDVKKDDLSQKVRRILQVLGQYGNDFYAPVFRWDADEKKRISMLPFIFLSEFYIMHHILEQKQWLLESECDIEREYLSIFKKKRVNSFFLDYGELPFFANSSISYFSYGYCKKYHDYDFVLVENWLLLAPCDLATRKTIMMCTEFLSDDLVNILISYVGANPNLLDENSRRALDYYSKDSAAYEVLEEVGAIHSNPIFVSCLYQENRSFVNSFISDLCSSVNQSVLNQYESLEAMWGTDENMGSYFDSFF